MVAAMVMDVEELGLEGVDRRREVERRTEHAANTAVCGV